MTSSDISPSAAIPIFVIEPGGLAAWSAEADDIARTWIEAQGFRAALGEIVTIPGADGAIASVLFGWGNPEARGRERFNLSRAVDRLPEGRYALRPSAGVDLDPALEWLGWQFASYRFDRYRASEGTVPELEIPEGLDAAALCAVTRGANLTRDLINTPARDMGPEDLEAAFRTLAEAHGARTTVISGRAELEAQGFPMIATVGAAAEQEPRLLDMVWGPEDGPKITLVGKGVCFDTGGLNIKPGASMGLMKKDMGGGATALGLASMIMDRKLPVRLRVLVPAVENAISGPAFRPGDILPSRKGLSVEINNTDAEGRLVLADALALADEESPDLLVSLATLTGAARVALGPDVPPFFCDDDAIAEDLAQASRRAADPLWRLPFWDPYEPLIEPGIADLDNAPKGGMAGAITAALFLRRFVERRTSYIHLDIYGWVPASRPGRPKGGAFQAARALLDMIERRYCNRI